VRVARGLSTWRGVVCGKGGVTCSLSMQGGAVRGGVWRATARRVMVWCVVRGGSTCGGAQPLNVARRGAWQGGHDVRPLDAGWCVARDDSTCGGAVRGVRRLDGARRGVARCVAVRGTRRLDVWWRGAWCGVARRAVAHGLSTWHGAVRGKGGVMCGLSMRGGAVRGGAWRAAARRAVARCGVARCAVAWRGAWQGGRDVQPLSVGRRGGSMCSGAARGAWPLDVAR